jgi:hypothetical protein
MDPSWNRSLLGKTTVCPPLWHGGSSSLPAWLPVFANDSCSSHCWMCNMCHYSHPWWKAGVGAAVWPPCELWQRQHGGAGV